MQTDDKHPTRRQIVGGAAAGMAAGFAATPPPRARS